MAQVGCHAYVQGGLKWFFFNVQPSRCIEAYVGPEKYWFVCVGLFANHLFNLNLIFLIDGLSAAAE